ncbi:MAG: TonB-dependent receptor [Bdellovibrionales bacterium]|nr:TonB-dependent receptor [Bdellovibrionales bacterium]
MIRHRSATLSILIAQMLAAPLALPSSAFADEAPAPEATSAPASAERGERIEVTGSRIKRIDTEGVSPVTTITRKDIEKSGYNSVSDVLRESTSNSFGSMREASGSNAAGNAEVNLRGLGSSNTLVLLNGERLPADAVTGAVDLNMIPLAAVERVEILKDGASAIYGSDALGGVVNIITRKDFSGNEASFKGSLAQQYKGGSRADVGLVNGVNGEKLNMVNVVQFRNNWDVKSKDRPWTDHNLSTSGNPGSYRNSGDKWHADPNCPSSMILHTPSGDYCQFNTSDYSTELPELRQFSVMSESHYEASSNLKLTARIGGTHRLVKWSYAPAPGTFTIPGASAPSLPGATPGTDLQVKYRLTDLGTRDSEVTTYGGNVLLGADLDIGRGWNLGLTTAYNTIYTDNRGVNGYAITDTIVSDIQNGTYRPFDTGNKGSLENARYVPSEVTKSQIATTELKTSGELVQMPAGALGLAAGIQMAYQEYLDRYDDQSVDGKVFGNAGSSGGGSRSSQAVYSELSIPAFRDFELQVAGRYDHYSDFGSTINPKVAALYHFTKDLLVRGSVGTGFKAPLMQELHAASSDSYETFIDAVACKAERAAGGDTPSCLPAQYEVIGNGNPGLKEEKSISFNLGSVYQATRDLSLGVDFYLTKTKNVVGIDYDEMTAAEAAGIDVNQYGIKVHRDSNGYIESIEAPLQNLASQDVAGMDISVGYSLGKFKLSTDQSQLFFFKEEGFPGTGKKDKLGTNGMPKWRNSTTLSYLPADRHTINLTAGTIGGHEKSVPEEGSLSHYTQLDLQYVYSLKDSEFGFGIVNVLGTTPPLDDSNPTKPLDVTLYDQIGRQVLATYKVKF